MERRESGFERASLSPPSSLLRLWACVLILVLVAVPGQGWAQEVAPSDTRFCTGAPAASVDERGLRAVYCTTSSPVKSVLHAAHVSAFPVFFGGVPAAWAGAWAFREDDDFTDAYRLTVVQVATFGVVTALKRTVGRPRPFVTQPLVSRSTRYRSADDEGAFESFPSGHASLSVALATSWSLSHPQWYVIAPSAVWAAAVTVSRLHLGVHYPSDVLAGAVLGAGIAAAVHLLRDAITPGVFAPDASSSPPGPSVTLRFRF